MNYGKGCRFPAEKTIFRDQKIGTEMWQMTNYAANHSCLYYTKNSFTPDSKTIVFLSRRSGWSNLYSMDIEDGQIVQLTDNQSDIDLFSPALSSDGSSIYYVYGNQIRKVNIETQEEEIVISFDNKYAESLHISFDGSFLVTRLHPGTPGVKSASKRVMLNLMMTKDIKMQDTLLKASRDLLNASLSRFRCKTIFDVVLVSLKDKKVSTLASPNRPGITLISPDNRYVLYHMYERELWCVSLDGKTNMRLYGDNKAWVTHPNWLNEKEVLFIEWPNAMKTVSLDGNVKTICKMNVRHPAVNNDRSKVLCDTTHPDLGLLLINPDTGITRTVCHPAIKTQWQWKRSKPPMYLPFVPSFIYDPFGSEWMHPHASFSPDGTKIILNASLDGVYSQIWIVCI
jgi:oligogalacturonide lyase